MTKISIIIPAAIAKSLSLPALSLVDGSSDVEHVAVHSLDGSLRRRATRLSVPLDPASAKTAHRTERLYQIRRYVFHPVFLFTSLAWFVAGFVFFAVKNATGHYSWWLIAPMIAAALADETVGSLISRSALAQHPRREKSGVRISGVPRPVAEEIVRLNPGVEITS